MSRVFDTPINTNDQSLDRVLAAGLPVALIFLDGAPSSELEQTMNGLARAHAGQFLMAKIEAKENPAAIRRYGINVTPALVSVKEGKLVSQAGAINGSDLTQHVAYLLGQGPKPKVAKPSATQDTKGTSDTPVTVSDVTFDREVLGAAQPALVDFWAPWCGPCKMVDPVVKKLAGEYAGRLRVAKVNVDENPGLSRRYGVQGIPTIMIFRDGQIVDRWSGALPEPAMRTRVQNALGL